jgi:hypothetical protein
MAFNRADRDAVPSYEGGAHAPDYNKDYEVQRILREQRLNSKRSGALAAPKNAAAGGKRPPLPPVNLKKDPHHHRVCRMDREKAKVQANDQRILEWKNDLVAYDKARGRAHSADPRDRVDISERNVGSGKITEEAFKLEQFKHQVMVARKAAKAAKENNTGGSAALLLCHDRSEVVDGRH